LTISESFPGIGTVTGASVGQQLWIELAYDVSSFNNTSDANARVDNVVLTADTIPEPASLALLAAGGLMIAGRQRRKG